MEQVGRKSIFWLIGLFLVGGMLFLAGHVRASGQQITMVIDNQTVSSEPGPLLQGSQVYVPIRLVAQSLGAEVDWQKESKTLLITRSASIEGNEYLQGSDNFISAAELKAILDDDNDNDLADYREGHNGGDVITNDPLVVDIRSKDDYAARHIPGAVWIAGSHDLAGQASLIRMKELLTQHVAQGGKEEIVLYCFTGNQSGLAAGVLGVQGLPVRSMMYGFDIAWRGTKTLDKAVLAPMEDNDGKTIKCGT